MSDARPMTLTNGQFDAGVSPLDRGLAYGDGLFETCRVRSGRVPLWRFHRERLAEGARRLSIPLDLDALERERRQLLEAVKGQSGVLKLILTRGQGGRAYLPPTDPEPTRVWQFRAGEPPAWRAGQSGVCLYECAHRLGDNPALAGMKHLNRLEYVLARSEWGDECPEGLLKDMNGRVIEGTLSNVFVRSGDGWKTPPLTRNGVAGVMRRLIIDVLAPSLSLPVSVTDLTNDELSTAREWFVCNSVFGIWPVTGLTPSGTRWPEGEETRRLQVALERWLNDQMNTGENA